MRKLTTRITVRYEDEASAIEASQELSHEELYAYECKNPLGKINHKLETEVTMKAHMFRCTLCNKLIETRHMSPCAGICEVCEPQGDSPRDVL